MKYDELTEEQKIQVKQNYLISLADNGCFVKTIYGDNGGDEREPSWSELSNAGELVSDDVMRSDGVDYVPEDFESHEECESDKILKWAASNITLRRFKEDHPDLRMDDVTLCSVCLAIDWAKERICDCCSRMEREK